MAPFATATSFTRSDPRSTPLATSRSQLAALSDVMLVERTKERDPLAFRELLGRHEATLLRLAQRLVRNDNDAQEVLQEVFITTWKKLGGFEDRAQISSWLYRVTVNASLMHLRLRKRRISAVSMEGEEPRNDVWAPPAGPSLRPDQQLESQELRQVMQDAISRLPPVLRSVLVLRDIQGCSTREAGQILRLTDVAVKTRLFRARRALREILKHYMVS
jgi:RNA polymerase sigma-70 factor (ECF subfamily)